MRNRSRRWLFTWLLVTCSLHVFQCDAVETTDAKNFTVPDNEAAESEPKEHRGLFQPRMDYDQWTPLGRGDPLKNDPTYVYVPPVLERVHYWIDPANRKPDPPVSTDGQKTEILVLGVSSKKSATHTTSQSQTADNRKDLDPFLKFVEGPKFNQYHHRLSRPYQGYFPQQNYYSKASNKDGNGYQKEPYTVLVPPPIPQKLAFTPEPITQKPLIIHSSLSTSSPLITPQTSTPSVTIQPADLVYHSSSVSDENEWKQNNHYITIGESSSQVTWRTPTPRPQPLNQKQTPDSQNSINSKSNSNKQEKLHPAESYMQFQQSFPGATRNLTLKTEHGGNNSFKPTLFVLKNDGKPGVDVMIKGQVSDENMDIESSYVNIGKPEAQVDSGSGLSISGVAIQPPQMLLRPVLQEIETPSNNFILPPQKHKKNQNQNQESSFEIIKSQEQTFGNNHQNQDHQESNSFLTFDFNNNGNNEELNHQNSFKVNNVAHGEEKDLLISLGQGGSVVLDNNDKENSSKDSKLLSTQGLFNTDSIAITMGQGIGSSETVQNGHFTSSSSSSSSPTESVRPSGMFSSSTNSFGKVKNMKPFGLSGGHYEIRPAMGHHHHHHHPSFSFESRPPPSSLFSSHKPLTKITTTTKTLETMQTMQPPPVTLAMEIKTPVSPLKGLLKKEVTLTTLPYSTSSSTSTSSPYNDLITNFVTPSPMTTYSTMPSASSSSSSSSQWTTPPTASMTTDPLFKHYKQPAEPLRGPMYLIIQGHSKVKTYGPTKSIHGIQIQETNEIQTEESDFPVKHLHYKIPEKTIPERPSRIARSNQLPTLTHIVQTGFGSVDLSQENNDNRRSDTSVQETELQASFSSSAKTSSSLLSNEKYYKGIVESARKLKDVQVDA